MSWFEQLVTGWIIYYLKRCVLVFTDKRILHIPTKMNFKAKASVAQIVYGDIAEAKVSGFFGRAFRLKYKTGKKEDFNYVESTEFKISCCYLLWLGRVSYRRSASGTIFAPGVRQDFWLEIYLSELPIAI